MRTATLAGAALALMLVLAAAAAAAASTAGGTRLRIVVRERPGAPARVATLRCDPASGTVPRPATACRRLHALGETAFAPTPRGMACTQIYGGPQEALVTGTLDGRPVWTRLRRRDGCELFRWQRVAFLLAAR